MAVIVQRLRKTVPSNIDKAIKYYQVLSVLNNLDLTHKQVELLAFTSVRGTITSPSARKEFVEIFDSSLASLENIKRKLKKKGWLVEVDRRYHVNPKANLDFSKDILLQINLISVTDGPEDKTEVDSPDSREDGVVPGSDRVSGLVPAEGFAQSDDAGTGSLS